jgi:LuxR family maltose regulon positive regulatory protein
MRNSAAAMSRAGAAFALRLAHRLGLVRSILDLDPGWLEPAEAARVAGLLDATLGFYLDHLKARARGPASAPAASAPSGGEPLSEREFEMVHALASAMPNKRIAQAFGISLETVKRHLKNIYGKLGVYGRDGAIARA